MRSSKSLLALVAWALSVWISAERSAATAESPLGVPPDDRSPVQMRVSKSSERLELMVNTSRILTLEQNIPRVFVSNPQVLRATPVSPNQVQVSGIKPGVTQVNLWDDQGKIFTVDVIVMRDVAELMTVLQSEFPDANLRIRPLAHSVYITGFVPRPEMVSEIMTLAEDYYERVINGITVGGVHQIALHVKVMEVSRTKLRELGLDWQFLGQDVTIQQGAGGILGGAAALPGLTDTVRFSIISDTSSFVGYLSALRQQDLVKLLSEPTLIAMTGRPASFTSGGKFPILVPSGLGTTSVQFQDYGTRVDFVPVVLGNGHIRLEVRPTVSELDTARGVDVNGTRVPGLTERSVDTAVEMRVGQTLALAGLIQNRIEAQNRGVPLLADLPVIGRAFSQVREQMNEVELLVTVTPELVAPLEAHQVPQCGPGQLTVSPTDTDLYAHGYLEVPNCALFGGPPAPLMPYGEAPPAAHAAPPIAPAPPVPVSTDALQPPVQPTLSAEQSAGWRRFPPADRPTLIGPLGYDPLP